MVTHVLQLGLIELRSYFLAKVAQPPCIPQDPLYTGSIRATQPANQLWRCECVPHCLLLAEPLEVALMDVAPWQHRAACPFPGVEAQRRTELRHRMFGELPIRRQLPAKHR